MYTYFRNNEINFELWDECITNSDNATIYAFSWFLNIACPQWDALIKASDSKYISIFPIPIKRKFGLKYIFFPPLCNQLGLFSTIPPKTEDFDAIFKIIIKNFVYVSAIPLNESNSSFLNYKFFDFKVKAYSSFRLDLTHSYERIIDSLTSDRKINIRRSQKFNLIIEESFEIEPLLKIFKLNTEKKIYGGLKEYQYDQLRRLSSASLKERKSNIYYVKNTSGKIIAGCWFLYLDFSIIKFLNSSTQEGRNKNADTYLTNFIIKKYAGTGLSLDFERESSEGVNKYKRSYKPKEVQYISVSYNRLPWIAKVFLEIRRKGVYSITKFLRQGV